jgi:hypothetical protein
MTKVVWSQEDEAYYVVCGDDSIWVPIGWDALYSEVDNEWYFVVSSTNDANPYSTWDPPCGVGWHAEWSDEYQLPYFVDEQTGETSWERPQDTRSSRSSVSPSDASTPGHEGDNVSQLLPTNEFQVLLTHFAAVVQEVGGEASSEDSRQCFPQPPVPFLTEANYLRFGGQALAAAPEIDPALVVRHLVRSKTWCCNTWHPAPTMCC